MRKRVAGAALARLLRSIGGLDIDVENLVLSASRHPPPTVWPTRRGSVLILAIHPSAIYVTPEDPTNRVFPAVFGQRDTSIPIRRKYEIIYSYCKMGEKSQKSRFLGHFGQNVSDGFGSRVRETGFEPARPCGHQALKGAVPDCVRFPIGSSITDGADCAEAVSANSPVLSILLLIPSSESLPYADDDEFHRAVYRALPHTLKLAQSRSVLSTCSTRVKSSPPHLVPTQASPSQPSGSRGPNVIGSGEKSRGGDSIPIRSRWP